MLVRDAGDVWQIVMQTDHADLSGQLAAAWGGPGFARPEPFESVVRAATRHDDGWATWERRPRLAPDGAPQNFVTVPVPAHLAFYRAGVEVAQEEDPYAGLLVSMHMSGLYRGRYGVMGTAAPQQHDDDVQTLIDAFVAIEEERQAALARELEVDEAGQWTNYALLQVFDVVSLFFGLANMEAGMDGGVDGVPTADGEPTRIAISPLGPWRVRFDPYPFVESPAAFTLVRRLVPKRAWPDDDAFRTDLAATPPETVRIYAQA